MTSVRHSTPQSCFQRKGTTLPCGPPEERGLPARNPGVTLSPCLCPLHIQQGCSVHVSPPPNWWPAVWAAPPRGPRSGADLPGSFPLIVPPALGWGWAGAGREQLLDVPLPVVLSPQPPASLPVAEQPERPRHLLFCHPCAFPPSPSAHLDLPSLHPNTEPRASGPPWALHPAWLGMTPSWWGQGSVLSSVHGDITFLKFKVAWLRQQMLTSTCHTWCSIYP